MLPCLSLFSVFCLELSLTEWSPCVLSATLFSEGTHVHAESLDFSGLLVCTCAAVCKMHHWMIALLCLDMLSLKLKAIAVQGCWGDESSLMMLPNMTPEGISQLASKGFQAVPQLCQAASENAANLRSTLTAVLGSSRDSSEVMQVGLLTIPCACCFAVHLCLLLLYVMHFKRNVLNVEMRLQHMCGLYIS